MPDPFAALHKAWQNRVGSVQQPVTLCPWPCQGHVSFGFTLCTGGPWGSRLTMTNPLLQDLGLGLLASEEASMKTMPRLKSAVSVDT